MAALGLEQTTEEGGGRAHLCLHVEALQGEHHGDPVGAHPRRDGLEIAFPMGAIHHHVAVSLCQGDEIAFGIDDDLLDRAGALFEQSPQQMRLARAGIALDQETGGQQLLEIEPGGLFARAHAQPHLDPDRHSRSAVPQPVRDDGTLARTGSGDLPCPSHIHRDAPGEE